MTKLQEIINHKKEFKRFILEGKSVKELALIYNCSKATISEAKHRLGYLSKILRPHDKTNRKALGITQCHICNKKSSMKTCTRCANKIIKIAKKKILIEQLGGKCEICGYDKYQNALDFHHIDPNYKEYSIGEINTDFNKLLKEISKCRLLCNRCHREIHYEESGTLEFISKAKIKMDKTIENLKQKYKVLTQ